MVEGFQSDAESAVMDDETLVLGLFGAIERRDIERIHQIYDPDEEFIVNPRE